MVLRLTQQGILEEGTVASGEEDVFYAEEQNIILEDTSGVAVTERFIADDRLSLAISTTGMSPSGSTTFTVGEAVSQNLFKTASGDIGTILGRVVSSNSTTLVIDQIRPDHTAMKQLTSEGGRSGIYSLFKETHGDWKTNQSDTDIEFATWYRWSIVWFKGNSQYSNRCKCGKQTKVLVKHLLLEKILQNPMLDYMTGVFVQM